MKWHIDETRIVRVTLLTSGVAVLVTALPHLLTNLPPADKISIFYRLVFFNDLAGSTAMLLALSLALVIPGVRDTMTRLAMCMGENPGKVAIAAFVGLALGARFVYLAHPFSMDESAPIMQAHAFAQGQMSAHYPPALLDSIIPSEFQGQFMLVNHQTGAVVSAYWPGLALLETPFAKVGLDWCLNPAFGVLSLLLIHRLASDVAGQAAAGGWAMLIALASPQFTVSAMSYYAMPGELALNLLFLWLIMRPDRKSAFIAGLAGGLALIMHNPIPHTLIALPCLFWLMLRRERHGRLAAALVGYMPIGLGLGLGWWAYLMNFGDGHPAVAGAGHRGFIESVLYTLNTILVLPTGSVLFARWYALWKMWIWACPGLLLALLLFRKRGVCEKLLISAFVLTFVFYLFVPYDQGHGWGYRYIHPAWGALPVIAGLALVDTNEAIRRWAGSMALAGLLATPIFLLETHTTIAHELSFRLTTPAQGNWVVFVAQNTSGGYKGDLVQNPPGPYHTRYLISHGEADDRALIARYFPGAVETRSDYRGSVWKVPQDMATWAIQALK